jgi:hypothetical protein
MKDIIYQMLKNKRSICKAKWHHNIFKMAITISKHFIPFIAFSNTHQIVCSTLINLDVHRGMIKLAQQP